jgi:hypothetical protein
MKSNLSKLLKELWDNLAAHSVSGLSRGVALSVGLDLELGKVDEDLLEVGTRESEILDHVARDQLC